MSIIMPDNIPRLYTALADWLACLLYIILLQPRFRGWRLWGSAGGFLLLMSSFMILTGDLPTLWFVPCILLSFLIMLLFLYLCADIRLETAAYFCARAFIAAELAASLEWQIYYYLYTMGFTSIWCRYALLLLVYALVFGLIFLLDWKHRENTKALQISHRELITAIAIAAGAYFMSNLSYVVSNTPFSGQLPAEIFNIRTMMDLAGVAILTAYHIQISSLHMRLEVDALQNMLRTQYAQYQQFEGSIDIINQKHHDLKHLVHVLQNSNDPTIKSELFGRIEADIKSYEAFSSCGNHALDTLLTSKNLYCQNHNIQLNCIVDGAALDFMELTDLCTLFGNALDNSIEAVYRIADAEKRLVRLSVTQRNNFVRIRVANFYEGNLSFERGLPNTTKKDKQFHGYGLKSIRQIVSKYGGSVTIDTQESWFELRILIPLEK